MKKPFKDEITQYLKVLQKKIILEFESFEDTAKFEFKPWNYKYEGGGLIGSVRGDVFEKAAVNFSSVSGPKLPFSDKSIPFLLRA
ncbi:MAG: Oxygen-dependent coproporphyrinogen-III oxidase [Chlamydiae bacterium]|nr:Oxygen-dependent coproporphyrinogen-III oxidase [Chlamydiota bacterium]